MLDVIQQQLKELRDGCLELIERMLKPNPDTRPTAADVLKDLEFCEPRPVTVRDWEVRYFLTNFLYIYYIVSMYIHLSFTFAYFLLTYFYYSFV